ncbi:type II toxin-antitoxin system HicB family antitoxin [Yersinia frederiksenii]|nr:type II toxin-antitoxin system HicB family antitoxin [Yersinia frederiksenii]
MPSCIKLHDDPLPNLSAPSQYWRGSTTITQLHEKPPIKRAGVAGIRLRTMGSELCICIGNNTMNNLMKIDGHTAVITFDPDMEMFRGEFIGLNGGADFYGSSVEELKKEGVRSLSIFLDECKKDGIEPYKSYSGKIVV